MYRCNDCKTVFDEPAERNTTYEREYGVSSLFPNSTPVTFNECPCCGSSDYEEFTEDDLEELYG